MNELQHDMWILARCSIGIGVVLGMSIATFFYGSLSWITARFDINGPLFRGVRWRMLRTLEGRRRFHEIRLRRRSDEELRDIIESCFEECWAAIQLEDTPRALGGLVHLNRFWRDRFQRARRP